MVNQRNPIARLLSGKRRWIQAAFGAAVFAGFYYFNISLWWLLGAGAVTGIVFGKVFCRWMCPMGFLMELMTGMGGGDSSFQQTYQYHKLGCPIAWISGALNKVSLFKVRLDPASCASCGLCDKACYISTLEPSRFSLFKEEKERPGEAFSCSKCLACVSACPSGSLKYAPGRPIGGNQPT